MFSRAVKDNTDLSWLGWVEDSMMGEVPRSGEAIARAYFA